VDVTCGLRKSGVSARPAFCKFSSKAYRKRVPRGNARDDLSRDARARLRLGSVQAPGGIAPAARRFGAEGALATNTTYSHGCVSRIDCVAVPGLDSGKEQSNIQPEG
jgi:hypothetical protein